MLCYISGFTGFVAFFSTLKFLISCDLFSHSKYSLLYLILYLQHLIHKGVSQVYNLQTPQNLDPPWLNGCSDLRECGYILENNSYIATGKIVYFN